MAVAIPGFDEPFIRPLMHDLKELGISKFLGTNDFNKLMLKNNLAKAWDQFQQEARNRRTIFSVDIDMTGWDNEEALSILFNRCHYNNGEDFFHRVAVIIIDAFLAFVNNPKLDLAPLLDTLDVLGFSEEYIKIVKGYQSKIHSGTFAPEVPAIISNASQLEEFLAKMNNAISAEDYNLTLTYAYSCLEGVFKAYYNNKLPNIEIPLELQKQASVVRDDIKKRLKQQNIAYPEQILMLTATITSAVSNARNGYSASHFDGKAEKWLAEFARDCVNSVARMILHFIIG